jgi:hypothetical protein
MNRTQLAGALLCTLTLTVACSLGSADEPGANVSASSAAGSAPASTHELASFCTLITKDDAILTDIAAGDSGRGGVDVDKLLLDMDAATAAAPSDIKETPQLDAALQHHATWVGSHCQGERS